MRSQPDPGTLGCLLLRAARANAIGRELRHAMEEEQIEYLPRYPEGRACRAPTTRRVLDFEPIQRGLHAPNHASGGSNR